ncbi:MAG TPA: hypothetical protein VJX67_19565, partial [Blastocatellia bacterium]|nr:hypothetical protein [Blastocatellia bacterium]
MQSGHKRRVVGILACVILAGASIWEIRTASASKVTARAPKATRVQEPSQGAKIALKVSGPDAESSARDANLFSDSLESIGNAQALTFDGDGNSMVAVYSGGANDQIQVRQRTSTGDLSPAIITNLPTQGARSFVTGHFSGGSDRDLAIGTSQGQVVLMYGRSDGTFSEGPRIQLGGSISKLATADFARTGFEDIVAVDQANRKIYRLSGPVGLGDNTNPPALDLRGLRGEIVDVLAADFDGNHLPGLAVLTTEMVAVIHQRSEGIFSRPQVIGTGHFVAMTAGNFSHDRHPGLAVASDRDVTVFRTSRNRGFGPGVSFPAGNGLVDIKSGVFRHDRNPEASSDIVVADGAGQVSVFVHDGSGFRPSVTTEWDQPLSSIAIGPMQHGLNTIAVGVKSGIAVSVVTGGTITVSTITDENDCPSCDVAGLLAIKGVNQSPGGGNGVSLREAIIAVNNDNVLHGSTNWTISFAGITHAVPGSSTAGFTQSFRNNCTQGPADFFWEVFNGGGFGDLPFINSPGTVIDGNLVDHSVNGVNNTKGPFVFVSGNNSKRLFLITSSAPGCTIQNLGIIQGVGDAVSVASPNDTIANNIIGLGCDSISPIELAIHNNNTGAGIDFLSGSVNETVTGNVIANNNNNGILVNGVSQSVSTPQNNTISGNIIGLSKNAQAGVVDPGVGTGNN